MTSCPTHPTERIPLVRIRRDGGTQVRAEMKAETVDEYTEALVEGDTFPPVVTFHDGEVYWLADGFHRVLAHEKAGLVDILAEIRVGSKRDALLFAVGANASHGLPRTNKDKRRAVEILLRDEEWAKHSNRHLADIAAVSDRFVGDVRRDVTANGSQSTERTGKDGRTINTAGIGKTRPAAPPVEEAPPPAPPPAPARHPVLDEIDGAADLRALDAAFNRVALAGLSEDDSAAAAEAYQRRSSELRAQSAPPPSAAAQPAPAATVTVDAAEWEALCQWRDSVTARAGAGDEASVGKVMRLIALAKSPNEHEAAAAAVKACRMIRERGLLIATSVQPVGAGTTGTDEWFEDMRKQGRAFWSNLEQEVLDRARGMQ